MHKNVQNIKRQLISGLYRVNLEGNQKYISKLYSPEVQIDYIETNQINYIWSNQQTKGQKRVWSRGEREEREFKQGMCSLCLLNASHEPQFVFGVCIYHFSSNSQQNTTHYFLYLNATAFLVRNQTFIMNPCLMSQNLLRNTKMRSQHAFRYSGVQGHIKSTDLFSQKGIA